METLKVVHYECAYNDRLLRGVVRIFFEDGSFHDFGEIPHDRFTAILQILQIGNIYWGGPSKWLFTQKALTSAHIPTE